MLNFSEPTLLVFSIHDLDSGRAPVWSFGHTNLGDGWIPYGRQREDLVAEGVDVVLRFDPLSGLTVTVRKILAWPRVGACGFSAASLSIRL
jgi:hypothetical protein